MSSRCGFKHHSQRSYFTTTTSAALLQSFPGAKCLHYPSSTLPLHPSSKMTGKYTNTLISQRKQNSLNLGACSYVTTYIIMAGLAKEKKNHTTVNEHKESHEIERYVEIGAPGAGKQASLLGDSGGVVNSLDFCPASLKSLGCFYFRCVLSSQWKAVTVNLRILHCQL